VARRLLALAVAGLLGAGALSACSGGGSDDSTSSSTTTKSGSTLPSTGDGRVTIGDAKIPASFPKRDVPLPDDATLKAVVSSQDGKRRFFSLTYSVRGSDLKDAAAAYKAALTDAGYRIEASSTVTVPGDSFSAFTARGEDWDVIVYGGGTGSNGALSLQVTPHDPSADAPGSGAGSGSETG
jgi:hypothetical protein